MGTEATVCDGFREWEGKFKGRVRVGAEPWSAVSETPLRFGQRVTASRREGLIVHVERHG